MKNETKKDRKKEKDTVGWRVESVKKGTMVRISNLKKLRKREGLRYFIKLNQFCIVILYGIFFSLFLSFLFYLHRLWCVKKKKRTGVEYWKCIVNRNKNDIADVMKVSFEKEKIRKSSEVSEKEREK